MCRKTILPITCFILCEVFLNYTGLDDFADMAEFLASSTLNHSTEKVELVLIVPRPQEFRTI